MHAYMFEHVQQRQQQLTYNMPAYSCPLSFVCAKTFARERDREGIRRISLSDVRSYSQ